MNKTQCVAASVVFVIGCGSEPAAPADSACGQAAPCLGVSPDGNEDYDVDGLSVDGLNGGKADAVDRVEKAVSDATIDGELDAADVALVFEAAGERISADEMNVIRLAISEDVKFSVTAEALATAHTRARTHGLPVAEAEAVLASTSFGGSQVPEAVTELFTRARLFGAAAYDVAEVDDDGEQVWTHYPALSPAVGNMAWDYTEVTPFALESDRDDATLQFMQIVGYETLGNGAKVPRYETKTGGTGNISAHYDETYHPQLMARGSSGQKWASNCAILSDGSVHCLPAVRRDINQRVILTNPALSRGRHLMYHGHISAKAGEITDVELSGIPSKLTARGKVVLVDPLSALQAWGFVIRDGLKVRWGNTSSGVPYRDAWAGVLREKTVLDSQCESVCALQSGANCGGSSAQATCVGQCVHDKADAAKRAGCAGPYERLTECHAALTQSAMTCDGGEAKPDATSCVDQVSELATCFGS